MSAPDDPPPTAARPTGDAVGAPTVTRRALLGGADLHDARVVRAAADPLRAFNDGGLLGPADVHVAATVGRLCGEHDPAVLLAAAFAVRAPRFGHVCADLSRLRTTVTADEDVAVDLDALPWPDVGDWLAAVAASRFVAVGPDADPADPDPGPAGPDAAGPDAAAGPGDGAAGDPAGERPLRLVGSRLYLDRYWRYERRVVADLRRRAGAAPEPVDEERLRDGLERLLPLSADDARPDLQRLAAGTAVLRRFAVLAGGPGTGKTTTVGRVLALLAEQEAAAGRRPPRVALAAPTGKAAARLQQAVADGAGDLATTGEVRTHLGRLSASTIHRLLGSRRANSTRFRHDRANPLPHDLVVVDETSMVPLALMAKLLDAVRPEARLLLVGDPGQLASVEAGAVLGDIVGPATAGSRMTAAWRARLARATGEPLAGAQAPHAGPAIGDGVVVLRAGRRFDQRSGIAALADAVQRGDAGAALAVLDAGRSDLRWIPDPPDPQAATDAWQPVRAAVVAAGARVVAAARAGDARAALDGLGELRLLCAHRRGPYGAATWVAAVERWLAAEVDGYDPTTTWHLGRPVLVTANDYQLGVFNGDVGVVVARPDGGVAVAFDAGAAPRLVSPTRLEAVETVHAMTVHKSQGSQFSHAIVVLPDPDSPILTRELLYTAVTRARVGLTVAGQAEAVRTGVQRRIQRASGLRAALWGAEGADP